MSENEDKNFNRDKAQERINFIGGDFGEYFSPEDIKGFESEIERSKKILSGYEKIKMHAELMNWAVRERFKTLPTVSALAATLLIVATFNDKLIILDNYVRVLLSALLFLIPASLWGLFYEVNKAEDESFKKIVSITEENFGKEEADKMRNKRKPSFRGFMPFIANALFTIAVFFIVYFIWR